jgi:hypothetical protein
MPWARRAPGTQCFVRLAYIIPSWRFVSTFRFNFEGSYRLHLISSCILVGGTIVGACASPQVNTKVLALLVGILSGTPSSTKCRLLLCLTILAAVVALLCFGEGDSATVGLMVLCGFVCATGVIASTGGRTYVLPINYPVSFSQSICREVQVFVAHAVISWLTGTVPHTPTFALSSHDAQVSLVP